MYGFGLKCDRFNKQNIGRLKMPNEMSPKSLPEMTVQTPADPTTPAQERARFFNSGNAFNIVLDPVPDHVFTTKIDNAMAPDAKTGFITCDLSSKFNNPTPATTPFLLARYARINEGDTIRAEFNTAGSIWYVISGSGTTTFGDQIIAWNAGDLFVLPGCANVDVKAVNGNAVIWVVTNEPQMEFENAQPAEINETTIDIVHYPAAEIDRQIDLLYGVSKGENTAGIALIFSSEKQVDRRNITPTMTLAMNTLPPGDSQRAHRHNSVAVALVVQGENCYSVVEGERKDWAPWATTVTPPTSYHSHHNKGDKRAKFLIVQDGGLYNQGRTMGFSFD